MNSIDKIPEIIKARKEYYSLKKALNKERRKIKSLYEKHSFVTMITSKDVDDFKLEDYILQLFQDLNYETKKPNDTRDLDVFVSLNSKTIGIEVKNGNLPSENDMFQARKYAIRHLTKSNKSMHPLVVWNNAKIGQEFDSLRIQDAEGNNYGIITTKELLKGYIKVKQGVINLNTFNHLMNKIGLIKFSNSILKNLDSSVSG
jgi:hypothetical protein